MAKLSILLDRLKMVAATEEMLLAEDDHPQLGRLLGADVPDNWPMPLYDSDARAHFLAVLRADPKAFGWTTWYILRLDESGAKTLIGAMGACGLPDDDGAIVIGYSLLDQFHGKGYATEALRGFLDWAGRHPGLRRVVADTFPHLGASIRVLTKCGFTAAGAGAEEGAIRFELPNPRLPYSADD